MIVTVDSLKVGDKTRFSTELLMHIESMSQHASQIVEIVKIEEDVSDGTKIVFVGNPTT